LQTPDNGEEPQGSKFPPPGPDPERVKRDLGVCKQALGDMEIHLRDKDRAPQEKVEICLAIIALTYTLIRKEIQE